MSEYVSGNPMGHGDTGDYTQYIIDQGWKNYTAEDHGTWKILYNKQKEILKGRACDEFMDNLDRLKISDAQIPDFKELSKTLKSLTGWEVVAVPGLIPDLPFFQLLSERKFPAGNFIRRRDQLDYIEEPDVFHDLFGHVPLLADPTFADYLEAYGKGGMRAHEHGTIKNLARLYWYTVEFGLMNTPKGVRIYGAGILSSGGESVFALEDQSPNRIKFDLKRVMQTAYRVDDYQPTYFIIDSFKQLFEETYQDFSGLYKELKAAPKEFGADQVLADDHLINEGTQSYHRGRVKSAS
ncbi:MAG: phhA [Micavibrio sp.]|nr:phhA [Micavibrio sp.]